MVEVEDDRIGRSAVDTWMRQQICMDAFPILSSASGDLADRPSDVVVTVCEVVVAARFGVAHAALPGQLAPLHVSERKVPHGLRDTAGRAGAQGEVNHRATPGDRLRSAKRFADDGN